MISKLRFLAFALCSQFNPAHGYDRAITYEIPSGRFGDQLITYMHAKWISYLYGMPLLYKPFAYSPELVLDDKEEMLQVQLPFEHTLVMENLHTIEENSLSNVLFITTYFPESTYELKLYKWPYFPVDWQDVHFISLLRSLICPKSPFPQTHLPQDRITVAAHVRRGGGFDDPAMLHHWPLKFPPEAFYIAQIKKIYEIVKQPLFVHIFTDDPEPGLIAKTYADALMDIDVVFDYRSEGNSYKANVLTDFFDMMRYQCLIRPESNYSIVAEKLGDFKIVIHPVQCLIKDKQIVITETNLILKKYTRDT